MALHNWDPIVLLDKNLNTCLSLPLHPGKGTTLKIKSGRQLTREVGVHVIGQGDSFCSINAISVIVADANHCIMLLAHVLDNNNVMCNFLCLFQATQQSYLYIVLKSGNHTICEITFY